MTHFLLACATFLVFAALLLRWTSSEKEWTGVALLKTLTLVVLYVVAMFCVVTSMSSSLP